jgi:hypothetical protein
MKTIEANKRRANCYSVLRQPEGDRIPIRVARKGEMIAEIRPIGSESKVSRSAPRGPMEEVVPFSGRS